MPSRQPRTVVRLSAHAARIIDRAAADHQASFSRFASLALGTVTRDHKRMRRLVAGFDRATPRPVARQLRLTDDQKELVRLLASDYGVSRSKLLAVCLEELCTAMVAHPELASGWR